MYRGVRQERLCEMGPRAGGATVGSSVHKAQLRGLGCTTRQRAGTLYDKQQVYDKQQAIAWAS